MSPQILRRLRALIRQFPENGMKFLLENAANVRDLLHLGRAEALKWFRWERMTLDRTTFVERDYRHVEADVVYHVPLRGRSRERLLVYILIEHQSEPDALMELRVLDYVVQIYKAQVRAWQRRHESTEGIRLSPVLPVVFYTGARTWERLTRLPELLHERLCQLFSGRLPTLEPLFINLASFSEDELTSEGGFFGSVLRLVQQRHTRPEEFRTALEEVVQHLETMSSRERDRWLEFLSYIEALVYHARHRGEHAALRDRIVASVETDQHRREVYAMGQTMAEYLEAKGRKKGRNEGAVRHARDTLLRLLRQRFDEVPEEMVAVIRKTKELSRLDDWLDRAWSVKKLDDMSIG